MHVYLQFKSVSVHFHFCPLVFQPLVGILSGRFVPSFIFVIVASVVFILSELGH